jgi:hypothetical protein
MRAGRLEGELRNLVLVMIQRMLRIGLRLLSPVVPQTRSVVVSVFPETEGNGLEVARALVRRYPGLVVWLTDGREPHADVHALAEQGMLLVQKASFAGLVHYLRAEAVFFTHGLYGSPKPCRRKPIVNLWHGDGPKATRPGNDAGSLIPSTYVVAGTTLFGRHKGAAFELPPERLLVTGNPRTDQFWQPPRPNALADLGITGDFVVWMPTFRRTRPMRGLRSWSEIDDPASDTSKEHLPFLIDGLRERGIQLVIKPHPMDADRRHREDAVTLSETDLVRAQVSLYSLLGQSRGLVTDYSSVWVDYLLLDRPMAFLVPDREAYSRALIPSDVFDWVPGELVGRDGLAPFQDFLADLDALGGSGSVLRKEVAARIGLCRSQTSADDLVTALVDRGVLAAERS